MDVAREDHRNEPPWLYGREIKNRPRGNLSLQKNASRLRFLQWQYTQQNILSQCTHHMLKLFATLPVSTTTDERSFYTAAAEDLSAFEHVLHW